MHTIIFKINSKMVYVSKALYTIMTVMVYIILFFWVNGILNMIMDIETIVLTNLLCNLFSPHFIYKIVNKHENILTDINRNISKSLLSYTENDENDENDENEISDTDSESYLLNIEIE